MTALSHRYDFVFLFDVANGNPNGDPDAGNLPRLDPETNQGLVTDVCLKRKIRNYAEIAKGGDTGYAIYVQEGAILNHQHRKAYIAIRPDDKKALTDKTLNPKDDDEANRLRDFMCKNFFDIRAFGAVMSTGVNCGQVRGPIQFSFCALRRAGCAARKSPLREWPRPTRPAEKAKLVEGWRRRRADGEPHHGPQTYCALRPLPRAWVRFS